MNSSTGIATKYGFQALTGGRISLANPSTKDTPNQSGGTTAATNADSGGQILKHSCIFLSGNSTSGSGSASTTTTTTAKTYTASYADSIQFYGTSDAMWNKTGVSRAGNWGYGDHTGWWFFGDDFEAMASKNVSKIEITFTRDRGGNSAATNCNFYVHNYESKPSTTSPTYDKNKIGSASVATNTTHTITITNATIINRIKNAKGICTVPTSQNKTNYVVLSATMKVKFTYTS